MSLRNWSCRNTGTIRTVPILSVEDFANASFRAKIKLAGIPKMRSFTPQFTVITFVRIGRNPLRFKETRLGRA